MNRKQTKTSRDFSMHQNGNIVETKIVDTQEEWKHILGKKSRYENIGVQENLPNIAKIATLFVIKDPNL
jgi:lysozyme family protein